MSYQIAVVGATGSVGRAILNLLVERSFPFSNVIALASKNSKNTQVSMGDETLNLYPLEDYDFAHVDIALFALSSDLAQQYAPIATSAGSIVIDNSSYYRADPEVPLIVPEVNLKDLEFYYNKMIIANPNCSTVQLVTALKPLHNFAKIKNIIVSTYQSASGMGRKGMQELHQQTQDKLFNKEVNSDYFYRQLAFNVVPQIDQFIQEDGQTKEEWKMVNETKRILDPAINIAATCVRVPVFIGHSESVHVEFEREISRVQALDILNDFSPVTVVDDIGSSKDAEYMTPIKCVGKGDVFVSRLRYSNCAKNALNMWIVSDNLMKGAALNAVQIAEALINNYL